MNVFTLHRFCRLLIVTLIGGSTITHGETLSNLALLAIAHDSTLSAARAQRQAEQEIVPQARSVLLPHITAQYTNQDVDRETKTKPQAGSLDALLNPSGKSDTVYRQKVSSISLRQPLFDLAGVYQYKSAKMQDVASATHLLAAQQILLLKISQVSLDYLTAVEESLLLEKQVNANSVLEKQAQALYEQGDGTITDVSQAEAKRLLVVADKIQAESVVLQKARELSELTGDSSVLPSSLKFDLIDSDLPKETVEEVSKKAQENNLTVVEQNANLNAVKKNVQSVKSQHLPTVGLVYTQRDQTNTDNGQAKDDLTYFGIEASWNLYEGGRVSSLSRQQSARFLQANEELEASKDQASSLAVEKFYLVSSLRQRIAALSAAVKASIKAEDSARVGLQVGYRTTLDVLDAEVQHYTAARDLLHARHLLLFSQLELEAAKGDLNLDDLAGIDRWMKSDL